MTVKTTTVTKHLFEQIYEGTQKKIKQHNCFHHGSYTLNNAGLF